MIRQLGSARSRRSVREGSLSAPPVERSASTGTRIAARSGSPRLTAMSDWR